MATLLERFEHVLLQIKTPASITLAPQLVMELLVDLTFIIHAFVTELHRELIERNGLDARWKDGRVRFVSKNGLKSAGGIWPM